MLLYHLITKLQHCRLDPQYHKSMLVKVLCVGVGLFVSGAKPYCLSIFRSLAKHCQRPFQALFSPPSWLQPADREWWRLKWRLWTISWVSFNHGIIANPSVRVTAKIHGLLTCASIWGLISKKRIIVEFSSMRWAMFVEDDDEKKSVTKQLLFSSIISLCKINFPSGKCSWFQAFGYLNNEQCTLVLVGISYHAHSGVEILIDFIKKSWQKNTKMRKKILKM